jgi:gamma-glutamylcyclotransferase (GGCT)/AIG2-like uncharacterized protein YtfP
MRPTPYLFVYGSLRSSATGALGRRERQRLQREATSLGAATLRGRLYDLGRYPGAVPGSDPTELVHGEVYRLHDAAASLPWLDAYEGYDPQQPTAGEYQRQELRVTLAAGSEQRAWTYVYQRDCAQLPQLPDGCWRG